jgi:hypothetical protein
VNETTPSAIEQIDEEEASIVNATASSEVAEVVAVYVAPATLALVGAVEVHEIVCVCSVVASVD